MLDEWIKWHPENTELSGNYDVAKIEDNIDHLKIFLTNTNQKIEILFDGPVWAYRSTDESFRLNLIHQLTQKYSKDFYVGWSFFKVNRSSYLKWVTAEVYDTITEDEMNHFVIMGTDLIVDVVISLEIDVKFSLNGNAI